MTDRKMVAAASEATAPEVAALEVMAGMLEAETQLASKSVHAG